MTAPAGKPGIPAELNWALTSATWSQLEAECRQALKQYLSARQVVDFDGPHGLSLAAANLGTIESLPAPEGMSLGRREVKPLLEVCVPFELSRAALRKAQRGGPDCDFAPALTAARRLAEQENQAIFEGLPAAGIQGLAQASTHPALALGTDPMRFAEVIAGALMLLEEGGIGGPFALVLGSHVYRTLAASVGHYPQLQHLQRLLEGPVLHAPAVAGGLLLSRRGGDFRLTVGQDITITYFEHDAERIRLGLMESFTFNVLTAEAVVVLTR